MQICDPILMSNEYDRINRFIETKIKQARH